HRLKLASNATLPNLTTSTTALLSFEALKAGGSTASSYPPFASHPKPIPPWAFLSTLQTAACVESQPNYIPARRMGDHLSPSSDPPRFTSAICKSLSNRVSTLFLTAQNPFILLNTRGLPSMLSPVSFKRSDACQPIYKTIAPNYVTHRRTLLTAG